MANLVSQCQDNVHSDLGSTASSKAEEVCSNTTQGAPGAAALSQDLFPVRVKNKPRIPYLTQLWGSLQSLLGSEYL